MLRLLIAAVAVVALTAAATFTLAGRIPGPSITVVQPQAVVGQNTELEITVESPGGRLSGLDVQIQQGENAVPLFTLASPTGGTLQQDTPDRIRLTRPIGRRALPALREGPARLIVTARRPVLFGLRSASSTVTLDLRARFTPPRLSIESSHHHVTHGGAELVLYRVTPPDSASGVRVGGHTFAGFPASALGATGADPGLKGAFFALLHDQDLSTPIELVARDEAGNESRLELAPRIFPRPIRESRIVVTDAFLAAVMPEIVMHNPELGPVPATPDELLAAYLKANGELRETNARQLRELARKTADRALWSGPFAPLANSKVESGFGDRRQYLCGGREIDRQVHLGYDLAVTAKVAVTAANAGTVVFAGNLGIYGNTVVIDHGLGLQSLYAHLSTMNVTAGEPVARGAEIGRSGMTGLAGGDHLHFAILLAGHPVNPAEWWDPRWVEDRIARKIREASR
jgi:hypothetical protein